MDGYIKEGWYKHDRRDQGIPKLQSTGITVDQDHTSLEEMRRSPDYNDFLARYGFQRFAGVAVVPLQAIVQREAVDQPVPRNFPVRTICGLMGKEVVLWRSNQ
jgi:hypothetical protein